MSRTEKILCTRYENCNFAKVFEKFWYVLMAGQKSRSLKPLKKVPRLFGGSLATKKSIRLLSKNESFCQKIEKLEKSWSQNFDFRTIFSPRVHSIFLIKGSLSDVILNFLSFEFTLKKGARLVYEKTDFFLKILTKIWFSKTFERDCQSCLESRRARSSRFLRDFCAIFYTPTKTRFESI